MKRLIASVSRLTQVLNAIADGVTVQDPSGNLVFVNETAARMMDCASSEEALALGATEILSRFVFYDEQGREVKASELPGRQALKGIAESAMTIAYKRSKETGDLRWTTIKACPIKDRAGIVVMAVNVLQDMTQLKRAETELKQANQRITKLLEQTLAQDDTQSAKTRLSSSRPAR